MATVDKRSSRRRWVFQISSTNFPQTGVSIATRTFAAVHVLWQSQMSPPTLRSPMICLSDSASAVGLRRRMVSSGEAIWKSESEMRPMVFEPRSSPRSRAPFGITPGKSEISTMAMIHFPAIRGLVPVQSGVAEYDLSGDSTASVRQQGQINGKMAELIKVSDCVWRRTSRLSAIHRVVSTLGGRTSLPASWPRCRSKGRSSFLASHSGSGSDGVAAGVGNVSAQEEKRSTSGAAATARSARRLCRCQEGRPGFRDPPSATLT